jgi:hypothetical protein
LHRIERHFTKVDVMDNCIPKLSRREAIRIGGLSVAGYALAPMLKPYNVEAKEPIKVRGGAEVCILIDLMGGASQVDSFDVREGPWTPADFDIRTTKHGVKMPVGLLPKLSERLDKFAIIRSMSFWESAHVRGTYYLQAGRVLSPGQIKEIPSVGAVVASETMSLRKGSDFLPPFISMNMDPFQLVGCGMLSSKFAPLVVGHTQTIGARLKKMDPSLPLLLHQHERHQYDRRKRLQTSLRDLRKADDLHRGRIFQNMDNFYESAYSMMDDPRAAAVFHISPEDHNRFGASGLGDACTVARNLIEADAGARFIFVAQDGWDLHNKAYEGSDYFDEYKKVEKGWSQYMMCHDLDAALGSLLDDLEAKTDSQGRRLIDKVFLLAMGEFGRTGGPLTKTGGRDHNPDAGFALVAGCKVAGGKIIGTTDKDGARVADPGWHRKRPIYPEDLLITLYSSMGIDWTKKITSTPSGRAFEYVENLSPKGMMIFDEVVELYA